MNENKLMKAIRNMALEIKSSAPLLEEGGYGSFFNEMSVEQIEEYFLYNDESEE